MRPGIAVTQHHLDYTGAIDNGNRHLITTFLTICERRTGKVQSNFRSQ